MLFWENTWRPDMWDTERSECGSDDLLIVGHQPPNVCKIKEWIRKRIKETRPVAVLVDHMLIYPGSDECDGSQVMHQLHCEFEYVSSVKIFMRTGNDDVDSVKMYRTLGADDVLSKGHPAKRVASQIQSHFQ